MNLLVWLTVIIFHEYFILFTFIMLLVYSKVSMTCDTDDVRSSGSGGVKNDFSLEPVVLCV